MARPQEDDEFDDLDDRDDPDESDMDDSDEPEMVQCPHCRKYVSEDAERCHHCGQDIEKGRSMPTWAVLTAAALLAVIGLCIYRGIF